MIEESESKIQKVKRIKPGVVLFFFVLIISTLLIYKIQNTESTRLNRESMSVQIREKKINSERQSRDFVSWLPENSASNSDSVALESEDLITQTAHRQPLLPDLKTVNEGELDSSSWQNPFYRLFWKSEGWNFTTEGMTSTQGQVSAATFLRPYKKISVSFQFNVEPKFPTFELQLLTRDPEKPNQVLISSTIHFQKDFVSVSTRLREATQELKRANLNLDGHKKSVLVRFVGTGNRFVISVGGKRVLTCAQPARQSGQECFLSFMTNSDQLEISALRIEGE